MISSIRTFLYLSILALSSTALAKPVALHGQTADVTIEVAGFAPTLGPGSLGGKYERLAQMQRHEPGKAALNASILVDTPPANFDPKKLPEHVLSSYKARFGQTAPTIKTTDTPPGFWFEFEERSVAGRTWNLYFESMAQGRWLEIHFSAVNPKPEELAELRQLTQAVLHTVTFSPKPIATPK